MSQARTPTAVLLGALALAGCAVAPSVEYHRLGAGVHSDRWVLFRLTDSVIVVGGAQGADQRGASAPVALATANVPCRPDACAIAAAAVPADDEAALLALEPRSKALIETRVTPTYQPSSLRLKTLLIEARDHRLEAINTVGEIASGVARSGLRSGEDNTEAAPPGRPSRAELRVPFTIDLAEARCESLAAPGCVSAVVRDPAGAATGAAQPVPENPGWTYRLRFLDDPRASGFTPRADLARVHGAMIGSVCRPVLLDLIPSGSEAPAASLRVLVADADWLETSPFPTKGAMNFQPLCGIDVQADTVATAGTDALAAAFFNHVAAVRAAQAK